MKIKGREVSREAVKDYLYPLLQSEIRKYAEQDIYPEVAEVAKEVLEELAEVDRMIEDMNRSAREEYEMEMGYVAEDNRINNGDIQTSDFYDTGE